MKLKLPYPGRRAVLHGAFAVLAFLSPGAFRAQADDATTAANSPASAANSEADKAWRETERLSQPPMQPAEWSEKRPSKEEVVSFFMPHLIKGADAAQDFYTRFPKHPKAEEAHKIEYNLLNIAVNQFGATNLVARLDAVQKQRMADPTLSEDERFQLRIGTIQGLLNGLPKTLPELDQSARALQKDYPKREEAYQILNVVLMQSEGDKARDLAKFIMDSPAPDQTKEEAKGILKRLDAVGKPVDIQYTAVDGRQVDLSQMKGKVVLVDFWATWCGPCMMELPHVKAAYEKLHDKGFEIVGISFDEDKDALQKTLKQKEMTWPQFFDGNGWKNKYAVQFGIQSIPTMWLVDKKGNLRDVNARGGLEEKVTKLLTE